MSLYPATIGIIDSMVSTVAMCVCVSVFDECKGTSLHVHAGMSAVPTCLPTYRPACYLLVSIHPPMHAKTLSTYANVHTHAHIYMCIYIHRQTCFVFEDISIYMYQFWCSERPRHQQQSFNDSLAAASAASARTIRHNMRQ